MSRKKRGRVILIILAIMFFPLTYFFLVFRYLWFDILNTVVVIGGIVAYAIILITFNIHWETVVIWNMAHNHFLFFLGLLAIISLIALMYNTKRNSTVIKT